MLSFISKLFGNKSERDVKSIEPIVEKVKEEFSKLEGISNDELRGKTLAFKETIKQGLAEIDADLQQLKDKAENDTELDVSGKVELYREIDKLEKDRNKELEVILMEILPEAFAVVKETARRLKEKNPLLQAVSVQPNSPSHAIKGLRHMGTSIVPAIYNPHLANRQLEVDPEAAGAMARQLAREEGLLVGLSAAAAVTACVEIAQEEAAAGRRAVIVTVLPDSADRYLSDRFWEEA